VARSDPDGDRPKRKRLGMIVRAAIYIPLLSLFGWQAWDRFELSREASDDAFRTQIGAHTLEDGRVIQLPDGQSMQVITPEQARELGVDIP